MRRLGRHLASLLVAEHFGEPEPKMAFVVGPRQCGKTTLARMLQEERGSLDLYRNWDDLQWRRESATAPYGFLDAFRPLSGTRPLATLDEIHKFPRWKRYLKGLWDTRHGAADILVTGSGRLDVYRRGGDSLLGRYHQYRLHPLSVSELARGPFSPDRDSPEAVRESLATPALPKPEERDAFASLLRFGGYPEPFLAQSPRRHRLWIRERRDRLLREDLRDLTHIQRLSSVQQMAELLLPRAASLLSLNNLREELGCSVEAIRLWMEQLERLFYCFRIRPYSGRLARTLRKEPKLYLWDWSELGDPGKRFENMLALALLRWCHFTQDWGQEPLELRFIRDKEKREVDFLLTREGKPFLLIEAKLASTDPGPALAHFSEKLGGVRRVLVVAELQEPGTARGTPVAPAASFMARLP